jgi:hypothetical protein
VKGTKKFTLAILSNPFFEGHLALDAIGSDCKQDHGETLLATVEFTVLNGDATESFSESLSNSG